MARLYGDNHVTARRPLPPPEETVMADLSRLPGPVAEVWEWQLQGACRRTDPDTFFHPEGERGPRKEARDRAAKAICAGCPVLVQCRRHSLQVREPYGVWGGLTEEEREAAIAEAPSRAAGAQRARSLAAAG
jgi:WhiB family redox-sensing transcriptional regulator